MITEHLVRVCLISQTFKSKGPIGQGGSGQKSLFCCMKTAFRCSTAQQSSKVSSFSVILSLLTFDIVFSLWGNSHTCPHVSSCPSSSCSLFPFDVVKITKKPLENRWAKVLRMMRQNKAHKDSGNLRNSGRLLRHQI